MYRKCPKCGCKRYAHDKRNLDVCPACGLIFSKWVKKQFNSLGASSGENSGYTSSKQNLVKRFVSPSTLCWKSCRQAAIYCLYIDL